jgi:2-polyprenyl-3-methyl-5-hydroxy-6-metoxy-1,4-benzoquinol methylase
MCVHSARRDPNSSKPLEGLKVIDVGCGGGILSEVPSFFSYNLLLSDTKIY